VRTAWGADRGGILAVVRAAFATNGRDGQEELDVVEATWRLEASPPGLELVAIARETVVGHVMAAIGDLAGRPAIAIAPLAVLPERQRQSIGSALVIELLGRLERDGWPMVLLLGDPAYYSRFGFEAAAPFGIIYPPAGAGSPDFMMRRFSRDVEVVGGEFAYCWEQAGLNKS
jgi:putative acetyltransferase